MSCRFDFGDVNTQPTSVEIEKVAIVLDLNVCHLLVASDGEREGAGVRGGEPGEKRSVEAALEQQLFGFHAGDGLMKPPKWRRGEREEVIRRAVPMAMLKIFLFQQNDNKS